MSDNEEESFLFHWHGILGAEGTRDFRKWKEEFEARIRADEREKVKELENADDLLYELASGYWLDVIERNEPEGIKNGLHDRIKEHYKRRAEATNPEDAQ